MSDWIHVNKDTWFEIREKYEQTFKNKPHSAYVQDAAKFCGIPFNTYRRIGKSSDWIEKESFMTILNRIGTEIYALGDDIQIVSEEGKEHHAGEKRVKKTKEHYGNDWYRKKALNQNQWAIEAIKKEFQESDKKIIEVASQLEHIFGWNPELIEKSFKSYKENDYIHLLFSEEELNLLKHIGEENTYGQILKHYKDNHDLNKAMYSLQDKGLIRLIRPTGWEESNIILKAEKNTENKIKQLKEPYNDFIDKINKTILEIEGGYFSCAVESCSAKDAYKSSEKALETEYKCPSCDLPLEFKDGKEIKKYLAATKQILEEVVQKMQIPSPIHN